MIRFLCCLLNLFFWFCLNKELSWLQGTVVCCVFRPAFRYLRTGTLAEIHFLTLLSLFLFSKLLVEKTVFLGFENWIPKAGWNPNAGQLPEGVSNFHIFCQLIFTLFYSFVINFWFNFLFLDLKTVKNELFKLDTPSESWLQIAKNILFSCFSSFFY